MNDKLGNTNSLKEVEYEVKELFNNAKNVFLEKTLFGGTIRITDAPRIPGEYGVLEKVLWVLLLPECDYGAYHIVRTEKAIYKLELNNVVRSSKGVTIF